MNADAALLLRPGVSSEGTPSKTLRDLLKGKRPTLWRACFEHLKPGGHLLAFAGTQTMDLISMGVRLAGFEVRDVIAMLRYVAGADLQPAWEPIILARKPLDGTVAENVVRHGIGGLNIDACRVGTQGGTKRSHQMEYPKRADGREDRSAHWARTGHDIVELNKGRWPANIITDGTREVEACFAAFGERVSKSTDGSKIYGNRPMNSVYGKFANSPMRADNTYDDDGSVMRYFASTPDDAALIRWLLALTVPVGGSVYVPDSPLVVRIATEGFRPDVEILQ